MNRFQFEEALFDALYAPMRAAWDQMESEHDEDDLVEIEELAYEDSTQLPLDC